MIAGQIHYSIFKLSYITAWYIVV